MLTTIKTSFPATLTPAFSPATVWKKLGDLSLMDFPLDAHQLAALERQRADSRESRVES